MSEVENFLADGVRSSNTVRGMATHPVNPQKVTSMVGQGLDHGDESHVTHLTRGDGGIDAPRLSDRLPDV